MDCCLSAAHASSLSSVTGAHWWLAPCHRHSMVANHLLSVSAGILLPVASVCRRTAACCQQTHEASRLSLVHASDLSPSVAHAGGLPPVPGACQQPAACRWCALAACRLSPTCAGGQQCVAGTHWQPVPCCQHTPGGCCSLPQLASAVQCPEVYCQHALASCHLSLVRTGGLPPVIGTQL